jgi:undecaprenyl-diphosphatase
MIMNELIQVILLGIIEGITEFLPVSSTGHLIVAADLLGFKDSNATFEIVIQLGAVLAVVWIFRRDLFARLHGLWSVSNARRFWLNLFIAFLPAAVCGLFFGKLITDHLFTPLVVAISLVAGGVVLWLVDKPVSKDVDDSDSSAAPPDDKLNEITIRQSLLIGVAQVAALVPGVSRSGSSIIGGLLSGLDRKTATAFSFYLAIPTLGGATVYKLLKSYHQIVRQDASLNVAVGTIVAFISALLVVGWLLRYIAHHNFRGFAIYRIVAGIVLILWLYAA